MLGTRVLALDAGPAVYSCLISRGREKGGGEEEDAKLTTLCLKPFIVTTYVNNHHMYSAEVLDVSAAGPHAADSRLGN